jgi:hypothetical protein
MEYLFAGDGNIFLRILSVGIVVLCGVYVSFDLGSMKNLSIGVTKLDQTQYKVRGIFGRFLSCMNTYGLGRYLYILQGTCHFEFFCKDKPPSTLQERASFMPSYYISFVNYLDKMGFL